MFKKKALAVVLAVAMCLTLFAGCLSVSATTPAATYSISVAENDGNMDATVTINSNGPANLYVARVFLSFDNALTVNGVTTDSGFTVTTDVPKDGNGDPIYPFTGKSLGVIVEASGSASVSSLSFVVSFATPENDTHINATIDAASYDESAAIEQSGGNVQISPAQGFDPSSIVVPAQEQQCQHEWELVSIDQPTITQTGTKHYACSKCPETKEETIDLPVKNNNIVLVKDYPQAQITDQINIVYRVSLTYTKNLYGSCAKLEATRDTFNNSYNYNAEKSVETIETYNPTASSGNNYIVSGIGMYELNIPITVMFKCYDADGVFVAYSNSFTYTPSDVLKTLYNKSSDSEMKTLITDLLNLGAKSQTYFSSFFPNSALAGLALPNAGFSQDYASSITNEEVKALNKISPSITKADGYSAVSISPFITVAKNPGLVFQIKNMKNIHTKDQLTYEASYVNDYAQTTPTDSGSGSSWTGSTTYTCVFNKVAFYDMDKVVTFKIKYNNEDVITYTYSIESLIATLDLDTAEGDVYKSIIMVSKSAQEYFINR